MEKVDLVIVGAEGVVENGGIINKVRTSVPHGPCSGQGGGADPHPGDITVRSPSTPLASRRHHPSELSPSPQKPLQWPNFGPISLIYVNHETAVYLPQNMF